ncbi:N-acetyltransferase [Pseudomonas sp. 15FMM2]|uniref:N-acetyltransferase n=1 Tax=Pseudomonas imrae TaxID=2992837 RepID=A0ACC7PI80_9PSED
MIRDIQNRDLEPVLDIWLQASIQAHHFIPAEFWCNQLEAMREIYLPGAMSRVFEEKGSVAGFYSVHQDTLAALFVSPERQGHGIGKQLLTDAMASRSILQLTVYSANTPAIGFYQSQGFVVLDEQPDEHTGHLEKLMRWCA